MTSQTVLTDEAASPIPINLTKRLAVEWNESVWGVTKLRSEFYVLCQPSRVSPNLIRVFEDRNPFHLLKKIEIKEIEHPRDIGSSDKENCLYVSEAVENCVWKITRETDEQYDIIKWLTIEYEPCRLSMSSDGRLLMVSYASSILEIYRSDAQLIRSIRMPRDIGNPIHAVETSIGNFIILHGPMENEEEEENRLSGRKREPKWLVSELTRDGQTVISHFIPSNETQELYDPHHLCLDSDDQVFVADRGKDRVILLNSDLKWNRTLSPTKDEEEEKKVRRPWRLCYDVENKQLIVGEYLKGEGVNVYPVDQN